MDAIVDAHLYDFDISDDLGNTKATLKLSPFIDWQSKDYAYKGMTLKFKF